MEKTTQHNQKSIELRSEKVRNIVGQIPSLLVRQGASIIGMVLLVLLGISAFVPYRKTIPVEVAMYSTPSIEKLTAFDNGVFLINTKLKAVKTNQIIGNLLCNDTILPIRAKITGQVIWNVHNNDAVKGKDLLCVVIPKQVKTIYGECLVDSSEKAMLKKGQKVILTNNLGEKINGQINTIYPTPSDGKQFKVRLTFDDSKIDEMYLNGIIVLSESSVLEYFIPSLNF